MSKILSQKYYTFDDVLLLPDYADFIRDDVDLDIFLHPKLRRRLPVNASPMDTVSMSQSAITMAKNGGVGVVHRSLSVEEQASEVAKVKAVKGPEEMAAVDAHGRLLVGAAVGFGLDLPDRMKALTTSGVDFVVADSAHGHTKGIIDVVKFIKQNYPDLPMMAGNITTYNGAKDLIAAGADVLRVGMGPGSICTTRIVTGLGVPQVSAVMEVSRAVKDLGSKATVIADGGIKQIGDIAKALAAGADSVMLGSMLAGFRESPGDVVIVKDGKVIEVDENFEGQKFKKYRGMGSVSAMSQGSAARYGQKLDPKKMVAEGVESLVKYKGDLPDFLAQIRGGLVSSFFYTGNKNLPDFKDNTKLIEITPAGMKESHPHSNTLINSGNSYVG